MEMYITDKSGKRFWRTNVDSQYASGERANLKRHLSYIKDGRKGYESFDSASAKIVEIGEECDLSDDDLLAELLS